MYTRYCYWQNGRGCAVSLLGGRLTIIIRHSPRTLKKGEDCGIVARYDITQDPRRAYPRFGNMPVSLC